MRILFIYPDVITSGINFCPAVHILSSVLKQEGFETALLHVNNSHGVPYNKEDIIKQCSNYDLFAITSTSFNYRYANEIAGWLKEAFPSVFRVLGGCHATIQSEDFEDSNFDIFCVGEGERPMVELVSALETIYYKIPNLITRRAKNPVRGFLRDLNSLPFWDFDITKTDTILKARNGWLSISFSRGCMESCTFCINHLYKKLEIGKDDKPTDYLRRRTAQKAIEELESLAKKHDIKFLNIDDDLLTTNRKWMQEFTDLYAEKIYKPFGIKYVINTRADLVTDALAEMLFNSGCKEARIGVETGDKKLRNELLQKRISDESLERAFSILQAHKVMAVAFLMLGLPGENWDTYQKTIDLV